MTRMIDMLTKFGEKEKRLSRDEAIDLINQVSSDKQGDQFDYLQFLSVYFKWKPLLKIYCPVKGWDCI